MKKIKPAYRFQFISDLIRCNIIIIIMLILLAGPCFSATYYVDATGGDDDLTGLSKAQAWQTITKVNAYSAGPGFNPDDRILFKRGETWSGVELGLDNDGTSGHPIIIGAYGVGDRPIIDGNYTATNAIDLSGHHWITLEQLHIKNSDSSNVRVRSGSEGIVIDDCYIEGSQQAHGISWDGINLILKNSTLYNNGSSGYDHAIYIDNCTVTARDVILENNVFDKHWGGTIKINSCNKGRISGIVIRYNLIREDKWVLIDDYASDGAEIYYNIFYGAKAVHDGPVMIFTSNEGTYHARNAKIYNNVIHHTPKTGYYAIDIKAGSTGHIIKNNIFYSEGGNGAGYIKINSAGSISASDYNIYYGGNTRWVYGANTYTSLTGWQGAAFDVFGIYSNPLFVNAGTHNYDLQHSSPSKNKGTSLSLTQDYAGKSVPYGGEVDIGAYEYSRPSPPSNLRLK
jgi:hypothetical protein